MAASRRKKRTPRAQRAFDQNRRAAARTAPLTNWLETFDRRVATLRPATDWQEYTLFSFVRHPQLQPTAWLDAADTPEAGLRHAIATSTADAQSKPLDAVKDDPTNWNDYVVEMGLAEIAITDGRMRNEERRSSRPTVAITPGMERSPDLLRDAARQIVRGKELMDDLISHWVTKIAATSEAKRVMKRLSPAIRRQVAALICDSCDDFKNYQGRKDLLGRLTRLGSEADRRRRELARRTKNARTALTELQRFAAKLDPELGGADARAAEFCLEQLDRLGHDRKSHSGLHPSGAYWLGLRSDLRNRANEHPAPDDPTQSSMVSLYWLFRDGCQLTGDEAEVRTGIVRNVFWSTWTKRVTIRLEYTVGESAGCEAVHVAVRRFKG